MNFTKTIAVILAACTFLLGAANATRIDLAEYARVNGGGVFNNTTLTIESVEITFRSGSYSLAGDDFAYYPYFDGPFRGRPGGLGVCRRLIGEAGFTRPRGECALSGDDNVDGRGGVAEFIMLDFSAPLDITGLSFRSNDHFPLDRSGGLIRYSVQSADAGFISGVTTFADLTARAIAGEFRQANALTLSFANTGFYLESITAEMPVPGSALFILSGLAALGFAAKRRANHRRA